MRGRQPPTAGTDWARWADAWEQHMRGYMPGRQAAMDLITELVARCCGRAPVVVELGSGTGALGAALCTRLPEATVLAVDIDPMLVAIGEHIHGGHEGRLKRVDLDVGALGWSHVLPGPVDAVVSVAALHVLGAEGTVRTLHEVHDLLRPGGLLLDLDWAAPTIADRRLSEAVRAIGAARMAAGDATSFWAHAEALAADRRLARLVAARRARLGPAPEDEPPYLSAAGHHTALSDAGFGEIAELWRDLDLALIAAVA